MKKPTSLLSIYSLIALFALAVPNALIGQSLIGSCSGIVTQNDSIPQSYAVTMELAGDSGVISYPSIGCGGFVAFIRKKGCTYYYKEHITNGNDICIDGGIVQIKLRKTSIVWYWSGSGVTVNGTLSGKLIRTRKHRCKENKKI
jgi:hypothetical protein